MKKKPGFKIKLDLNSLKKQIKSSKRLNKELGTDQISPVANSEFKEGILEGKFRKKLNNKN